MSTFPKWLRTLGYAYSIGVFTVAVGLTVQYHLGNLPEKNAKLANRETGSASHSVKRHPQQSRTRAPSSAVDTSTAE